jgi:hypothetical protein
MQSDVEKEDREKNRSRQKKVNTKKLFTLIRKQEKIKKLKIQNSSWFNIMISFD